IAGPTESSHWAWNGRRGRDPETAEKGMSVGRDRAVVVTGGAGFISSNLADALLRAGERVIVFDNLSRPGVERNLRWLMQRHPGGAGSRDRGHSRRGASGPRDEPGAHRLPSRGTGRRHVVGRRSLARLRGERAGDAERAPGCTWFGRPADRALHVDEQGI